MSSIHFVTGKLGEGKTLVAVSRALPYLNSGRIVATNLDLFFDKYPESYTTSKPYCIRLPDQPTSQDLKDLGFANTTKNVDRNGLLIFDECGTWFNSHGWKDSGRKEFVDVLIHIRKLGWDCIFIVQNFEMIDKQARNAICQYLVTCTRLDRLNVPILSFIVKTLTGKNLPLPRVHIGKVQYGHEARSPRADSWIYRGTELYDFYDTNQIFSPEYSSGSYCYLKPSNFHYDKETKLKAKKDYSLRSIQRLWHLRPPVLFFFILGMLTVFMFGLLKSAFSSATSDSDVVTEIVQISSEEGTHDVSHIKLRGVFSFGREYKYYFELNGQSYDPSEDGFAYLPFGKCGATLVKDDFKKSIVCESSGI